MVTTDRVAAFAALVAEFEAFIAGGPGSGSADNDLELARYLALLHAAALRLPDTKPADPAPAQRVDVPPLNLTFGFDLYPTVVHGDDVEPPITLGSLSDDVQEVRGDLLTGLALFDRGLVEDSAWEWRFQHRVHWGRHALGAIVAIHDHRR